MERLSEELYIKLTPEQRQRLEDVAAVYSRSWSSVGREAIVRFLDDVAGQQSAAPTDERQRPAALLRAEA